MADRVSAPRTSEEEGSRVVVTGTSVPEATIAARRSSAGDAPDEVLGEHGLGGGVEDRVQLQPVPDQLLDELDLPGVGRVRLDEEVVDLGRDGIGVVRG